MQSLALTRPTSLLSTRFGQPTEPEDGLAKSRPQLSPNRPEQHGYPSPPMSEPQSPSRRPAQSVESARLSYSAPADVPQRTEERGLPLPPPSSSLFNPRSALGAQGNPQQQPLYPGEPQDRGQALPYHRHSLVHHTYGNTPLQQYYRYGYQNASPPPYAGRIQISGPMSQQAIAPPPARSTKPARRTKAHVASACVNCKKAHLSCDVQRPCGRCVASGKQDTCKDVQHKKRGRPRLRDDREFILEERGPPPSHTLGAVSVSETFARQSPLTASHPHRASDPLRALASAGPGIPNVNPQVAMSPCSARPNFAYQQLPVVYLNLDLVIQKSNQAFADLVSFLGDIRGKHLADLLEVRQNDNLQRLRNELRDERDEREPTYMAPITPVGQDPMRTVMESVVDQDIDHLTQGFTDRSILLSFRLPSGDYHSLQVQVRLAKTSLYFVTLVVRSLGWPTAPPLLTQQLAPPIPRHTSQKMSAPTMAPVTQLTPQQARPPSSASSTPSSPFFNFSSVRTSLPTFSPSSYGSSPSYNYSPAASTEPGYFHTYQPLPKPATSAYPSPYAPTTRTPPMASEPLHELNRPERLEGLHLPPIRTGPAPLGSPLHIETELGVLERDRVRPRMSPSSIEQRRPETPGESGKRRRLNIHEVLE
ncbi:hypothetical protein EJ02DRAFT_352111 [Clathrospora elynae]|uniref:Zn(2)-C6 fungal-type domain-containing protein n=1 Tax=Clathrospora elynae TaxID=706981 RepID=A0A6A5SJG2_9PLEO|nr:hypothetical protein EJ02DRAFT_352111 [Clathrospora elynae]